MDHDFPIQKYLNQGLSKGHILMIKNAFHSYVPVEGTIVTQKYQESLIQSGMKDVAMRKLGGKEKLNFDEFFEV